MKDVGAAAADVLVVLAFDHALVDADSSVHIAHELDADLADNVSSSGDRAEAMDNFFKQLAQKRPQLSYKDIRTAAERLPFSPQMMDAVRLAAVDFGETIKVVSDTPSSSSRASCSPKTWSSKWTRWWPTPRTWRTVGSC